MAVLGCCQLDHSNCLKAAIKIAIEMFATITLYKFSKNKNKQFFIWLEREILIEYK